MRDIVVIGGGFAGVNAAMNAADQVADDPQIRVVLISNAPHIVMRPRLYEKDPEKLAVPLLPLLDPVGVDFVEAEITSIDTDRAVISGTTLDGQAFERGYAKLILAAGSVLNPSDGLQEHTFNIDSYESAIAFDNHLKKLAQATDDESKNTFVILGAGMTGIELACELRQRLVEHGGQVMANAARIVLVERASEIGPGFGEEARPFIEAALMQANVEIKTGLSVEEAGQGYVRFENSEQLAAHTVVVTTGMGAHSLTREIASTHDGVGRLSVDDYLNVEGFEDIYAAGDVALAKADDDHFAMMSCQHALTTGKYAGFNAACALLGTAPRAYQQPGYTTCLNLGTSGAVFTTGWERTVKASGEEAKTRKRWINTELIYPPEPVSREDILSAMRIDENGR